MELKQEDLINIREQNIQKPKVVVIDRTISDIVGKDIRITDPRLIKLIATWKNGNSSDAPDNFLEDPKKIEELKQAFV